MAVENLNVVMSRVGLLDIHLEFWIVLGFVLFLLDRRWIERRQADDATTRAAAPGRRRSTSPVPAPAASPAVSPSGGRGASRPEPRSAPRPPSSGRARSRCSRCRHRLHVGDHRDGTAATRAWRGAFGRAVARESFGIVLALAAHADRDLHDHVDAVVPPLRLELAPWVDNLGATWRLPPQRDRVDEARSEDRPGDPDPPVLRAPLEVDPAAAPDQLLREGLRHRHRADPRDRQPVHLLGERRRDPVSCALAWRRLRDWRAGFITSRFFGQYLPWFLPGRGRPSSSTCCRWCRSWCSRSRTCAARPPTRRSSSANRTPARSRCTRRRASRRSRRAHVYRPFVVVYRDRGGRGVLAGSGRS